MSESSINSLFFTGENLSFDFEKEKKKLIDNLDWLKNMSVEEQTFYKKWEEVQSHENLHNKASKVRNLIWTPTDINDEKLTVQEIENLNPKVVPVSIDNPDWTILRIFCHTAEFNQSPGRYMKFLITDGGNDQIFGEVPRYLGFIAIASDVITIRVRDEWLGWTHDNRIVDKKLDNSSIGTCVAPTQPFGFNFLGGKLTAALATSKVVRDKWKEMYNDLMVGMSVTSLYGSFSQYTRMKWWKECGKSAGKIPIKPNENIYQIWHDYIKKNRTDEYNEMMTQKEGVSGPVTSAKMRVLNMIFNTVNVKNKTYQHGYERGVYYSLFYENGKEYFQNKTDESKLVLRDLYQRDVDAILEWWKPRAIDRYRKLKDEGRLNSDVLFYSPMIGMSYEEARKKYLKDVGR